MAKNGDVVRVREVYQLIETLREENNYQMKEIREMFATFHKEEFVPVRDSVQTIRNYGIVLFVGLNIALQVALEWFKTNILRT